MRVYLMLHGDKYDDRFGDDICIMCISNIIMMMMMMMMMVMVVRWAILDSK